MARTITFQPSKELGDFVEGLVQTGTYNNQSEVIREGLRLLQERTAKATLTHLRHLIDEGEHSGDLIAWDKKAFLAKINPSLHVE
jgi:antitoxin ParD1/3/4